MNWSTSRRARHYRSRGRAPSARQHLRQAMIGLRTDDEIDERRPFDQQFALRLSDATSDRQQSFAPCPLTPHITKATQPAKFGEHLRGRLLANVAGVQDDQIRVVGLVRDRVAVHRQGFRHTIGIVDVHLTAVSFDEKLFGHVAGVSEKDAGGQMGRGSAPSRRTAGPDQPGNLLPNDAHPRGDIPNRRHTIATCQRRSTWKITHRLLSSTMAATDDHFVTLAVPPARWPAGGP